MKRRRPSPSPKSRTWVVDEPVEYHSGASTTPTVIAKIDMAMLDRLVRLDLQRLFIWYDVTLHFLSIRLDGDLPASFCPRRYQKTGRLLYNIMLALKTGSMTDLAAI